jgi:dipeptidyl aminopeptidase/acylaminoacyl peptidase
MIIVWTLLGGIALLAAARGAIRRSLAPERVAPTRTPADLGLRYETVGIATANGKRLAGWLIPAATEGKAPAVVVIHGWGGNADTMLPLAPVLHEAGFALLLVDARCHGLSDEDSFTSLPRFAEDLGHAIDWLKRRTEVDAGAIALLGHSVGAGAVLLTAARREDIAAAVIVAAFTHPVAMMRRWFAAKHIPYLPFGWLILRYVERVIGHRFDDIAPVNSIRDVRCPTLLVHGADDATVPVAEARAIYAARAGDHVRLKVVAGSHDGYADLERDLPVLASFLTESVRPAYLTAKQ